MVDETTALRVAEQERRGFLMTQEGVYGADKRDEAIRRGFGNIVYRWSERRGQLEIRDMLTEEVVTRKTFPPKVGSSIFSLHPDDVKPRMTVYPERGGRATLISQLHLDKPYMWLARIESNAGFSMEEIDVRLATANPRVYMGADMVGGEDELEYRRR